MNNEHKPYGGDPLTEIQERVRRIEVRVTNLIKQMGFAPVERAKVVTDELVGVTGDGKLVAANASVPIGDLFFAAQRHHLRGMVDVYVGNRYFGQLLTTRE